MGSEAFTSRQVLHAPNLKLVMVFPLLIPFSMVLVEDRVAHQGLQILQILVGCCHLNLERLHKWLKFASQRSGCCCCTVERCRLFHHRPREGTYRRDSLLLPCFQQLASLQDSMMLTLQIRLSCHFFPCSSFLLPKLFSEPWLAFSYRSMPA